MPHTEIPVFGNTLGFETINATAAVKTLTSTKYEVKTTRRTARAAVITIDGDPSVPNGIRWTTDGTDPVSATTGHFIASSESLIIRGLTNIAKFKFTREGGTSVDIQVTYFD